jgi:hypothetical protein
MFPSNVPEPDIYIRQQFHSLMPRGYAGVVIRLLLNRIGMFCQSQVATPAVVTAGFILDANSRFHQRKIYRFMIKMSSKIYIVHEMFKMSSESYIVHGMHIGLG